MAGIWEQVLGVERVGRDESFFDLGGHSLLATQVVARIREALGVEVPLRALFEGPTVAELAARAEEARARGGVEQERIERGGSERKELSYAQQRLWFLDQLEPGSSAYLIPAAVRLEGRLDVAALEQSLGEVVRRHEVLRSRILVERGQAAAGAEPSCAHVRSRSRCRPRVRSATIARGSEVRAAHASRRPRRGFRPDAARICCERGSWTGDGEHVLLVTMHHIASDGWSIGVIARELGALYSAFAAGSASPLEELAVQYGDYAAWQRDVARRRSSSEGQLAYWREQLDGVPTALDLPTDRPRPFDPELPRRKRDVSAGSGDERAGARGVEAGRRDALYDAARRLPGSAPSPHRAATVPAWHADRQPAPCRGRAADRLLRKHARAARRRRPGGRGSASCSGGVRETALGAYAHQEFPSSGWSRSWSRSGISGRTPLFQVLFVMQNAPGDGARVAGRPPRGRGPANADLRSSTSRCMSSTRAHAYSSLPNTRRICSTRRADRADAGSVRARSSKARCEDAEQSVALLPMLGEEERRRVVEEWNATEATFDREACLHELIREQARRTPDAVALVSGREQLSYRALIGRANQLARTLRREGIGPDHVVGVCLERSAEMVVSLLGVLSSGAAYLPLETDLPASRIATMLDRAGAQIVLTHSSLRDRLPQSARAICLDLEWDRIGLEDDQRSAYGRALGEPRLCDLHVGIDG